MSTVFAKPVSENKSAASLLVIRIGIAFTFFWAGYGKASDPAGFGMMLQNMAGIQPEMATSMALMIGILEIISGALVLSGLLTRPAAIFQTAILIGSMVMFGFDFTTGPAIWKDPAILGVAIGLVIYGSGKFGIDFLISKKVKTK
ncbi:MAG: DoxX family protein [Thaumarchaeota archaeon]|nr:DoxX family protein [Nitrososphaerota archaeon]